MVIEVNQLSELDHAAKLLLNSFPDDRVFLFYGNMGAGKTTFIKALCKVLEVEDNTSSPTFSIVNEYSSSQGPIFHFDFYRIKEEEEAYDFGYEDYFYSGNYCFVEWPNRIPNLLPDDAKTIEIEITSSTSRKIIIK
ncbi:MULTISPECIES: tRNA (adenosine(37)-N6)-threonylcarbamoyltransferase complex ATPase subunit type 1 TsaE [Sphingobacterium]|jgi:tRNA threonylcarbamoyladenosine biosynthesis protein TsaE|uniref:tRNA (adenosine(37)-N6)-threonylcarbamoyltransferase complex ATPase subunit type 1 TsaE n=1 Tax=Sphingobacterium TaxID=28453 RepID=UPI0004E5FAD1|nr:MULTISPECIES: tRNA (adenosine(37)-N6)-threonylcarbamoyltransferase complex ATPase subunit type 1 TsaE [Sphingobacterium]CDS91932.1 ATPase [Sphingobacterium sp. PM2-P1-29]SJN33901.1 TsaE protein, required for threonylcarbamoyladenosine t(6)A37 formation in tRNA [Sphingobacterium faecium PCAi_F2.5]HCU45094.1 tRNA (adenosine(37)-N6)-threonylcarbamoyltransferase complex ATPase subunit type 1 TsaE [Sphingobacterium sp.]UPZ37415.1 tRNA (adenosine(37)-N6)-threonylcarbamoyltransferase complex ATPase